MAKPLAVLAGSVLAVIFAALIATAVIVGRPVSGGDPAYMGRMSHMHGAGQQHQMLQEHQQMQQWMRGGAGQTPQMMPPGQMWEMMTAP